MPDRPFKSMGPDPDSLRSGRQAFLSGEVNSIRGVECERCGALVFTGDWPFCGGDARRHERGR